MGCVNQVVFPHARLTAKQTGLLTEEDATRWLDAWSSMPDVVKIAADPRALADRLPSDLGDFGFDLLVLRATSPAQIFISGEARGWGTERPELMAHLDALVAKLKPTYEHGDKVPGR